MFVGTNLTAAPEQYGYRQTDGRADIYALGIHPVSVFAYGKPECTGSQGVGRSSRTGLPDHLEMHKDGS